MCAVREDVLGLPVEPSRLLLEEVRQADAQEERVRELRASVFESRQAKEVLL